MFSPNIEQVTAYPSKAIPDYQIRFKQPCVLTYSDNTISSIFEGTGVSPAQHPLSRQFTMLGVGIAGCGNCGSTQVEVVYARFDRPLDEPSPGDVVCAYEIFCQSCHLFTYRQYT